MPIKNPTILLFEGIMGHALRTKRDMVLTLKNGTFAVVQLCRGYPCCTTSFNKA